jgi:hypothetical protein
MVRLISSDKILIKQNILASQQALYRVGMFTRSQLALLKRGKLFSILCSS